MRKHFLDIISKVNRLAQKLDLKVWSPFNLFYTLIVYAANFKSGEKQNCIKTFLGIADKSFCKLPIDSYDDLIITLEHLKYLNFVPKLQYIMTEDLVLNEYGRKLLKECNVNVLTCSKNADEMSHISLISNLDMDLEWTTKFPRYNKKFLFSKGDAKFIVELMTNTYDYPTTKFYHDEVNNKIAVKLELRNKHHYCCYHHIYFVVLIDNDLEKGKIDLSDDIFDPTNYIKCEKYNRIRLNLPEFEITNFVDHIENPELAKLTEFNTENTMVEELFGSFTKSIKQDSKIRLDRDGVTFSDKVEVDEYMYCGSMGDFRPLKIVRVKDKETTVSCVKPFRWLLTNNNFIIASGYIDGSELQTAEPDRGKKEHEQLLETDALISPIIVKERIIKEYVRCNNVDKEYIPRIIFNKEFDGKFNPELKNKTLDELKPLILKYDPECDDDDIKFYYDGFISRVQFSNCCW